MNKTHMHISTLSSALLIACAFGIAIPVYSQIKPEIANCAEVRAPATQAQLKSCAAHAGCRMVMELYKTCGDVKGFLDRLGVISIDKRAPNSSDAFEAAAPPINNDPAFTRASQAIKSRFDAQPTKQIRSGTANSGASWIYEGPIVNGQHHGTGVAVYSNGNLYRLDWVDGRQTGQGEYTNLQGRDVGDMQRLKLNGNGIRRYPSGERYVGQFKTGKLDGQGTTTWPNGDRYEGSYVNGNRTGQGTYSWASGTKFVGEWRDNEKINGQATNADGKVIAVYTNGSPSSPDGAPSPTAGEALELFGKVLGAVASGTNSKERKQAVLEALTGDSPNDNVAGVGKACTTENKEFQNIGGSDYMFYSPFDCVTIEWRQKTGRVFENESGRQGRAVNSCPCRVSFRTNGGTLNPLFSYEYKTQSVNPGATHWADLHKKNMKPIEAIPGTSCHQTNEIAAEYDPERKKCRARKCKNGAYSNCDMGTTK